MSILGAVPLTVTRASGSYVDSVWTPGAGSTFGIEGSIQPLNGRELLLLPEGQRSRGAWKLYTADGDLRTLEAGSSNEADRITWDGKVLLVVRRIDHSHHPGFGLAHYKYELREAEA